METRTSVLEFEQYKIIESNIRFIDSKGQLGLAEALGCIGTLSLETEIKNILKMCAGEVKKEVAKAVKLNGTISGHILPNTAIELFGLSNEDLKEGIYGYKGNKTARGLITLTVTDMYEEQNLLLAFPLVNFLNGLSINIESGQEEIAMLELPFSGIKDKNGYFYYQAYEKDIIDPLIVEAWHTNFDEELVKLDNVVGA